MKFHLDRFIRALILALLSLVIFYLHYTNQIGLFLNPEYLLFTEIASVLFLFLFFIQVSTIWTKEGAEHDWACQLFGCSHETSKGISSFINNIIMYGTLALPVIIGLFFVPTVLDSSIAEKRTIIPKMEEIENVSATLDREEQITITDDTFAEITGNILQDPESYNGYTVQLSGMLHKAQGLTDTQYILSRFQVTHCVADATVINLIVEFDEHPHFHEHDSWVRIIGEIRVIKTEEKVIPIIQVLQWEKIEMPDNPYVCI
ncbi:TIGR03943 family putative permease subunit [Bacillus sp. FJAT-45350]|uniref:TIGR03943 family putative permease subunit n=1 Tax=Bacillus sp. FJAT-45350 TaxID=2011014 RepID=UPI000BB6A04C|nr:TIGR03943 family protein [Bacillus sp. FJAT-45350]